MRVHDFYTSLLNKKLISSLNVIEGDYDRIGFNLCMKNECGFSGDTTTGLVPDPPLRPSTVNPDRTGNWNF